ncbi:MAG: hypothetical protein ACYDGR_07380 [Candidatus Dormibacteria bacterium]
MALTPIFILDHTGKQYFSDLYDVACFRMAVTSDDGATVSQNVLPGGCAGVPKADRQWCAIYDPPSGPAPTSPYTMSTDGLTRVVVNVEIGLGAWIEGTSVED